MVDNKEKNEMRNCQRVSFPYMAHISFDNKQDTVQLMDLSMQGLRVKNTLELSLNDKVMIDPILPEDRATSEFKLEGVVIREDEVDRCVGIKINPSGLSGLINLAKTVLIEKKQSSNIQYC